jgi:hypothetical protein
MRILAAAIAIAWLAPVPAVGQTRTVARAAATDRWTPSHTPWGDPDLQGMWDFATTTPFERPSGLGEFLSDEELAARITQEEKQARDDRADRPATKGVGAGPEHWYERGLPSKRTSMVVDPPDGKVPPLTLEAQQREKAITEARRGHEFDTLEHRDTYERCFARPIPRTPTSYNNAGQILQTPGYVVIHYESMHDTRVIPLGDRPHLGRNIQQWNGDPRGRWEGHTLVVDSTNFSDKQDYRGNPVHWAQAGRLLSQRTLHLVERFTRVDADTIEYEVTVDDPRTWTRPWKFLLPWKKNDRYQIFEYACHEGNYSITNIFSGARAVEKEAAKEAAEKR